MFDLSDSLAANLHTIPSHMIFPEPMTAAEERQHESIERARAYFTKQYGPEKTERLFKQAREQARIKQLLEEAARARPGEIELYGLSNDAPVKKSSKFPLPTLSAEQVQKFRLFVQKAKPLSRMTPR